MSSNNFKSLFYSVVVSYIYNSLSGIAMLYVTIFCLPYISIKEGDLIKILMILCISFSVGILPALSYNLIRFRMVKSDELNYGMWRFAISTVLPFIAPMLIYGIAYLNGFRLN